MTANQEPKTALQLLSEIAADPTVLDVRLGVARDHVRDKEAWAVFVTWREPRPDTVVRRGDSPLEMLRATKRILAIGASLGRLSDAP